MKVADPVAVVTKVFYCLDERRYQDILDLFTENGQWLRKGKWCKGRHEILQSLNDRPASQIIRHVMTNAFAEVTGAETATVRAYMLSYTFDDGQLREKPVELTGPSKLFTLVSELVMVDGEWKVVSQSSSVEFNFKP